MSNLEKKVKTVVRMDPELERQRMEYANQLAIQDFQRGKVIGLSASPQARAAVSTISDVRMTAEETVQKVNAWHDEVILRVKDIKEQITTLETRARSTIEEARDDLNQARRQLRESGAVGKKVDQQIEKLEKDAAAKIAKAQKDLEDTSLRLAKGIGDALKGQGHEVARTFASTTLGKDVVQFVNGNIVQPIREFMGDSSIVDQIAGDAKKLFTETQAGFSKAWDKAGGYVFLAFYGLGMLGKILNSIFEPPPQMASDDWFLRDWKHQLGRWNALMQIARLRLPWSERSFQFYTLQYPGASPSDTGLYGGAPGGLRPGSWLIWGLASQNLRQLLVNVERRLPKTFKIFTENPRRIEVWRDGDSADRYMGISGPRRTDPATGRARFGFTFEFDPKTGWPKLSRWGTGRTSSEAEVERWRRAGVTVPPDQIGTPLPEIPARLFRYIPPLWIAMWYANDGTDFKKMLQIFEEEQWKMRDKFPQARPPGDSLLIAEGAWGVLSHASMLPALVSGRIVEELDRLEKLALPRDPNAPRQATLGEAIESAPVVGTAVAAFKSILGGRDGSAGRRMLVPDEYRQILEDIDTHVTGSEHLHQKRLTEIERRPLIAVAIAHAKALRVQAPAAVAEAERLVQRVKLGTNTPEEAARLVLLQIALFGPEDPGAVEQR